LAAAQDEPVESETCLDCHEGLDQTLAHGSHALRQDAVSPMACVSCHAGGAVHIEDPSRDNITSFKALSTGEQTAACEACHQPHIFHGLAGIDPHAGEEVGCVDCHVIHGTPTEMAVDAAAGQCAGCHVGIVRQFQKRSNHPLVNGGLSCISCHNLTGDSQPAFGHGSSTNCVECHADISGPFRYEHQAASSFSTEGDGCVSCHRPHGSSNERLLAQPDDRLCRQCHGVPPLHRTQHGGLATIFNCIDCHSDIHGSNSNHALLDPQLGMKIGGEPGGCYCHNVSD
jgi:DmsE family decaheme c-type cytochrome